jgi:hypothetical protein
VIAQLRFLHGTILGSEEEGVTLFLFHADPMRLTFDSSQMDLVSPQPFWPLRNGLLSVYPSLKEDVSCDIVVLGAGISEAFVAECLTREGLDVVVLDKRDVGGGSTSASTALLQYEIDMPLVELSTRIGRRDAEECYRLCP